MPDTDGPDETNPTSHAPDWYADPTGRAELRYYDGTAWTDHVVIGGEQQLDALHPAAADERPPPPGAAGSEPSSPMDMLQSQTSGLGQYLMSGDNAVKFTGNAAHWEGGGHITNEPILLVEEHATYLQTSNQYEVKGHDGTPLGSVRQVGQSGAKQAARALTNLDRHMTHQFEVLDTEGRLVLRLTRPAKVMKSKVIIEDSSGQEIGRVVQENVIGRIRFALESGGTTVGKINGKSWSQWDFVISDASGTEVGRINKSFAGLGKALLAGGDNYVVALHRPLPDPLRLLVVASGVCIDTALHMDDGPSRGSVTRRGLGRLRF